jgi:hypothetical protein
MPDGSAILSARVKKASRPDCDFECIDDREDYKSGTCRLKWRILEPGDGAVLQIIYAGTASRDPKLDGVVEGQKDGVVVEPYDLAFDRTTILRSKPSMTRFGLLVIPLVIGSVFFFMALRVQRNTEAGKQLAQAKVASEKRLAKLRKKTGPPPPIFWVLFVSAFISYLAALAFLYFFHSPPGPPFGW